MSREYLWNDRIIAYLHDPPDKPLDIKGHVSRTRRYAELASGREVSHLEAETGASKWADIRASEIERLPLPSPGERYQWAVFPHQGKLEIVHPLSGGRRQLDCSSWKEDVVEKTLSDILASVEKPQARFLALWRLLPEKLAQSQPFFRHLPAETRVPDHTIWNHLDTSSMLFSAYAHNESLAFISLSLGPVQGFIAASRSLRDLWTSSMLLSWLTFQSMIPLLEEQGPTAFVFPQLRGNPLMDLWLANKFPELKPHLSVSASARKSPCLPNRFVAMLSEKDAERLAQDCTRALRQAWREVAHKVRKSCQERGLFSLDPQWDRFWQGQVDDYFEIYTAVLPWQACSDQSLATLYGATEFETVYPEAAEIRALDTLIPPSDRPNYKQDSAGRWQARMELLGRLLETHKQIRKQPHYYPSAPTPPKCSLLGSYEQLGPVTLSESAHFWAAASQHSGWTRIRSGERFSAIALIKRFAAEDFLLQALDLDKSDLGFWDTATLAAVDWLRKHRIDPQKIRQETGDWSGQWLHAASANSGDEVIPERVWQDIQMARKKGQGLPPNYYAVLMIDGDEMGKYLQGEKTPPLHKSYHTKMVEYFRGIQAEQSLNFSKAVTPALHASISEALANFALHVAPAIVEKHRGVLIYAGGDDVLALLPTHTALACARELRGAFRGEPDYNQGAPEGYYLLDGQELLMMGPSATLSAGLAVVHYKEDLRLALNLAREAEKIAKQQGRNALALTAARRSGKRATVLALWEQLRWMQEWVSLFAPQPTSYGSPPPLSNAWVYHLREVLPVMKTWTLSMMQTELKRQINRLEDTRRLSEWFTQNNVEGNNPGECMAAWFESYLNAHQQYCDARENKSPADLQDFESRLLEQFILLCQSLAFLARGREE